MRERDREREIGDFAAEGRKPRVKINAVDSWVPRLEINSWGLLGSNDAGSSGARSSARGSSPFRFFLVEDRLITRIYCTLARKEF